MRYEQALTYFRLAYEASPHPELLYNIALSADRLRRDAEALEAYRAYLAGTDAPRHAAAVQARIALLEQALASPEPEAHQASRPERPPRDSRAGPPTQPSSESAAEEPVNAAEEERAEPIAAPEPHASSAAPLVLAATVAGGGLVTALAGHLVYRDGVRRYNDDTQCARPGAELRSEACPGAAQQWQRGRRLLRAGWSLAGLGSATGLILLLTRAGDDDHRDPRGASAMSVACAPSLFSPGVVCDGRF